MSKKIAAATVLILPVNSKYIMNCIDDQQLILDDPIV